MFNCNENNIFVYILYYDFKIKCIYNNCEKLSELLVFEL